MYRYPERLPPNSVAMVSFDLDGTVINAAGDVTERVRRAVSALHERRILVAFATGRPLFAARALMEEFRVNAPSMFFSGAVVVEPRSKQPIFSSSLDPQKLLDFVRDARDSGLHLELYRLGEYFVERENRLSAIHEEYLVRKPMVDTFEGVIEAGPIVKAVLMAEGNDEELRMRDMLARHPHFQVGIAKGASHPDIIFANATDSSASRHSAFKLMLRETGVDASQVCAFGDGESDIPFLGLAGFGVAMGNSGDDVKRSARFVTASVEEDGVAVALEVMLGA